MFSIAAINDIESRGKWEPLAPTKEAQEFHLTQAYHEGLLKLQAKDYEKARELLESVLKDPLISSAQVDNTGTDGHLLQLRFLALKNLATVFLGQGSAHYESALHCYLQAVEIDAKDSVIWNQLGTLSCSMGLWSISRWAFEQGLYCSPNNWNCMEKLLEVLIAIGDEVACLSVAELILRHWPSHSRALHVKNTIEESEPIPFAPKGIDKLEPRHVTLKFPDKRKATNDDLEELTTSKRLKQTLELHLPEASWTALTGLLLEHLLSSNASASQQGADRSYRSGDRSLKIKLPHSSENVMVSDEKKGSVVTPPRENMSRGDCDSEKCNIFGGKETSMSEEQHQERRSSRLERLRSRKPGKEELELGTSKHLARVAMQFLEPFIMDGAGTKHSNSNGSSCFLTSEVVNPPDIECGKVIRFVQETLTNYGAYHLAHLLLEEVASRDILYQDAFDKFLELEKLTRHWGRERTLECSLFLAELYYDFGSRSPEMSGISDFMSEVSYHLCKIIESVALDYPFHMDGVFEDENHSSMNNYLKKCQMSKEIVSLLSNKRSFWVRFFWLSGRLSIFDGNKAKARQELCVSLSLLTEEENMNKFLGSVCLPHCKTIKELTIDRVSHELSLLEIDFLLKKTLGEMIEKHMYHECINLLAPLLFSTNDMHLDALNVTDQGSERLNSVELSALDVLIKACEQAKLMDVEMYLNCHRRKLQILLTASGLEEFPASLKASGLKDRPTSETESRESSTMHWNYLVAEEVKAISQYAVQMKSFANPCKNSEGFINPCKIISEVQSLLLTLMCNIASVYFSKNFSGLGISNQNEQMQRSCFINAAIAFCKLQHLNPNIPIKTQVELLVAIHDMLAEYGLCCAGGDGEEYEGTFLKLAIKHLLALDMKLKSNFHSSNKGPEMVESNEQPPRHIHGNMSQNESNSDTQNVEMSQTDKDEGTLEKETIELSSLHDISFQIGPGNEKAGVECDKLSVDGLDGGEKAKDQVTESSNELTEEERQELELGIDNALDQCFFCLYGLNLRSESFYEDDLATHRNTSRGDYQTKEQCADVFQYILPYAKALSRTGLVKLRRVLRAIRKHFSQPPDDILAGNAIDKFLDDPELCEDKLSEEAGSDGFLDSMMKIIFSDLKMLLQQKASSIESSEPYLEVYSNLYYLLAQSEEISATDKWAGFVLTKEGEEFVEQTANLFKYDLLYNPLRFESWQRLANIYDEEVDLLLNDGSKQINVTGWRKNGTLSQRVETSRRRSRRCLLMTLALAKTTVEQGEIHELLALVYYDGLQNVVPFYDQRSIIPSKDSTWMTFCQNAMKHFKKAFAHREDWSHAFYLGKLCEKLRYSHDISFSYYDKASALNPSAVDTFYRIHASRLKLLYTCSKQNKEALKVVSAYSSTESTKETAMNILVGMAEDPQLLMDVEGRTSGLDSGNKVPGDSHKFEEVWHILYNDCLSALRACVEGDLKHFHKARYMLAQGLYKRGETGDLEKAKEELSFCFKSSRSSFTINMWEIDSMVKKGRRKTPGLSGNKKALEVNLAESSRKFITCIRKYILLYLKLLEETGDICTLDRACFSLRSDKRFSLCLEDIVPVALGRYIKALIVSMHQIDTSLASASSSIEHVLEKFFSLFLEQANLWSDICNLPETKTPEFTEISLYGYLYQYIQLLEKNVRLETLEGINEKIRKRLKNPKLSNSNCAKVHRHVSVAWCRSLVISMALITPLHTRLLSDIQVSCPLDNSGAENNQLLCVDLLPDELWNSLVEDKDHLKDLETKWNPLLAKVKNVIIKRASDEDLETATTLLRSAYSFYRDTSCALLPSGVNLYMVPSQLATETYIQPGIDGIDILDMYTSRKLLMWAFTLLHGRCTNISAVVKYCEENAKSKTKKGTGSSPLPSSTSVTAAIAASHTGCDVGGGKDGVAAVTAVGTTALPEAETSSDTIVSLDSSKKSDSLPEN